MKKDDGTKMTLKFTRHGIEAKCKMCDGKGFNHGALHANCGGTGINKYTIKGEMPICLVETDGKPIKITIDDNCGQRIHFASNNCNDIVDKIIKHIKKDALSTWLLSHLQFNEE